jgi:hypothetical protein
MTGKPFAWGAALGVALGCAYAASPLSVWFAAVTCVLFRWAGRGLAIEERRYVWATLAISLAIRVYTIAVLALGSDPAIPSSFFWDGDGAYLKQRALVLTHIWSGVPVAVEDVYHVFDVTYGWSAYLYVLALLQYLTGPAPFGVHLFNVVIFMAAAVVLYRLARSAFGRAPAFFGLALMLFLPTLIAWSVSALKESLFVFLFAVSLWGAVTAARSARMRNRVFGLALLAGSVAAVGAVRPGASVMVLTGLGLGLAASVLVRRPAVLLVVLVCVLLGGARLWQVPAVQAQVMSRLKTTAVLHIGSVRTDAPSYRVLDQRMYSQRDGIPTMTPAEGLRYVLRAAISFVVAPLPWQIYSRSGLVFLPQQLIWYILLVLAAVGFAAGIRRDPLVSCLLVGLAATGSAAVALTNGNIGTMVRFRDWIVPLVVWLSALGGTTLVSRIMSRAMPSSEVRL